MRREEGRTAQEERNEAEVAEGEQEEKKKEATGNRWGRRTIGLLEPLWSHEKVSGGQCCS